MRHFISIVHCCAAIVLPATTLAQDPRELTAEASVRLGLEHNARTRAARADAAVARAGLREAAAGRRPTVRALAGYTRIGGDIPSAEFTIPGTDTTFTLLPIERDRYHSELSVEQPLYTGGRLSARIRAAAHEAAAAALMAEREQVDAAFDIRRAYWTLYAATAVHEAAGAALAQVEAHLADVQNRLALGAALRAELLSVQTRRSEVLLEQLDAENAVRVNRLELNRLLGLPLDAGTRPAPAPAPAPLGAEDAPLPVSVGVENQPEIGAMTERVSGLRAQLDAARAERSPTLGFIGRYVYARPNPYAFTEPGDFRGTWEAGFSVSWGLWEGGRRSARIAQAAERLAGAEARLADARERAEVEAARERLAVDLAERAVVVTAEHVRGAEESFRVARQQFGEGASLTADVLEAERAFRAAQARHARAVSDSAIARAALRRALGEVW